MTMKWSGVRPPNRQSDVPTITLLCPTHKVVNTRLLVHQFFSEVEASSHHLLAERHHVRRSRQIPCLVVPHPACRTSTGLDLVHDQVRTRLIRQHTYFQTMHSKTT